MKKIVSLVLALVMLLSLCGFANAATYADLTKGNAKYVSAVDALTELKVIEGFPDNTFRPDESVTRAQLAKMLVLCSGLDDQAKALNTATIFSDVDSTHWASGYIAVAAQSKLIVGYPDGTFLPEKEVSYAEAFTMALRALGYGNVVESEGTWPTAYMLKAVELGLNDDMEGVVSNKPATRGNTAIILWNMLRTEMWRISAESEKNGMTKTNTGDYMLNVKFPDYKYVEDGIITDIEVIDNENVTLTLDKEITAKINDVDLVHLIEGQKVSALIKEGKKDDVFLTLTPSNEIISGFAEDKNEDKLKINGKEYRLEEDIEINVNDYVVVEVEGKKITAIKTLPTGGTFVETLSRMKAHIDEEDLVIRDGKWTSRDAIKVGDVYTEVEDYFVVSSDTFEGLFQVVYTDTVKWDGEKVELTYLSIDTGDYRLAGDKIVAKKDKDNKTDIPMADLKVKIKDNEYTDKDIVIYNNYLDIPVRIEFGDVKAVNSDNSFYAIVSNGAWSNGSSKGKIYNIGVVGIDGEEDTLRTVVNADLPEILASNKDYYKNNPDEKGLFAWIELNDEDEIETLVILENGLEPETNSYGSKYTIAAVDADSKVNGKKVMVSGEEYTMTSSTIIFETRAHKNDDDEIDGFNVYVSEDYNEYDNVILPEGTLVALDSRNKIKFLFITNEAESNEIYYGIVEKGSNYSKDLIKLDGEEYEITKDSIDYNTGDVIKYSFVNNKIKVKEIFDIKVLDDATAFVVDEVDRDFGAIIPFSGDYLTLEEDETDYKDHKKFKVYNIDYDLDNENIEINELELQEELGYAGLNVSRYDRIWILEDEQIILVLSDLDEDEKIIEGTIATIEE